MKVEQQFAKGEKRPNLHQFLVINGTILSLRTVYPKHWNNPDDLPRETRVYTSDQEPLAKWQDQTT